MSDLPAEIRVRDLNCCKQPEALMSLLNDTNPSNFNVITVQELPYFIATQASFQHKDWHLILPSKAHLRRRDQLIRSVIYVNKSIPTDSYSQIYLKSLDVAGLHFSPPDSPPFHIYSVYNPPKSDSTITFMRAHLNSDEVGDIDFFLFGDFNKHHVMWSGPHRHKRNRCSDTSDMIQMLAKSDLILCLPPCTPTFYSDVHKTWSTIDLVFATPRLAETITKCTVHGGFGSDHRSIDVTINLTLGKIDPPPRYKWREVDWKEFLAAAEEACSAEHIAERSEHITNAAELDKLVSNLLDSYVKATHTTVPLAEKSAFSKRWFTRELKQQLRELNALKNRAAKRTAMQAEKDAVKPARNACHSAL